MACAAATSCSEDNAASSAVDSGAETAATTDGSVVDGSLPDDVSVRPTDAAPFDGGPLPIVCTSPPCATALVTTSPGALHGAAEGYCALLQDGTVACWGANDHGQLGRGEGAGSLNGISPARVVALADVVELEDTCALDRRGAIWCWGTGAYLQDDAGATTTERTPVRLPLPPATKMSVGSDIGCAEVDTGLLCWGTNNRGQLAPFDQVPRDAVLPPTPVVFSTSARTKTLIAGEGTLVLRDDGTTSSWGKNPPLARVSSLNPDPHPRPMLLDNVTFLRGSGDTACATVLGVGYCWGGATLERALPEALVAPEPLVRVTSSGQYGIWRWCAVGASGDVYCWGANDGGQAGDGTKNHAYTTVKVVGLPAPAVDVATEGESTCALLTTGKVHCWGTNMYGQLGNGSFKVPSVIPREVVLP